MPDHERWLLAAEAVKIISDRWQVTGGLNLLKIAARLFSGQALHAKYYDLRTQIMSEWLLTSKSSKNSHWYSTQKILKIFNQLNFGSPLSNAADGELMNEIINVSATIHDPELKNDAKQILSLFT